MNPEQANAVLSYSSRHFHPQPNGCVTWNGSHKGLRFHSLDPMVYHGGSKYRVRRMVWIAAGHPHHLRQLYSMSCTTKYCVALDHIRVDSLESKGDQETRSINARKDERRRAKKLEAGLRCEGCGAKRSKGAIAYCRDCGLKVLQQGCASAAYSAHHLKSVHQARQLRLGRIKLEDVK